MMRRSAVPLAALGAALLLAAAPLGAQAADTAHAVRTPPGPLFTARDALWAGGFLAGAAALAPVDQALDDALQEPGIQSRRALRGAAVTFRVLGHPGAELLSGALYVTGRLARKPGLADTGLHTFESIVLADVMVGAGKYLVGRARPARAPDNPYDVGFGRGFSDDDFRSFPSGHSATAFAAAAAGTSELGRWAPKYHTAGGVVLYSGATLVGLSRMYHQRHWASDVVMGAAIGTFSGWKVVHYNHAHPGNRVDRLLLGRAALPTAALPTADGGVLLVWVFPR